jgi:hypothetical protein
MKTQLAKKPREVAMDMALDPQQRKCRIHFQYANLYNFFNFFKTFLSEKKKIFAFVN